jgi:hypothetical protein
MKPILPGAVVATAAVAGLFATPVVAAEKTPGGRIEERPFGGPPPILRTLKRYGKKCQTKQQTCTLKKEDVVGSKCACPGRDSQQGTVVE